MVKTIKQFYILAGGVAFSLLVMLTILLFLGDKAGQPLEASLTYQPEGSGGLPQVNITFQEKALPVQSAAEASFEITPAVPGDFSWKGLTLSFSPAVRLQSDTTYRVQLRGGLKFNGSGRSSYKQTEWFFHTRPARIVFLKREGQATNLWITGATPGDDEAHPLTFETERQVLDFTVSPGGERIIYSLEEVGGQQASLWLVNTGPSQDASPKRLLYETNIRATAPRWSPGGDVIAYERRLLLAGGALSQPQLWLIQPDGNSLAPLYGGSERYGTGLVWAMGGSKAFFWEYGKEALGIFSFGDEPTWKSLPGVILQNFTVSPDGRRVIIARYDYSGATQKQLLFSLNQQTAKNSAGGEWQVGELPFSDPTKYNDSSPGWSPDGKLVAFLRTTSEGGTGEKESRIWLYEPGTGKTGPLVPASDLPANTGLGNYQWSPDSQKMLFERFPSNLKAGSKESDIWEINRDGTTLQQVVRGGFSAKWVY